MRLPGDLTTPKWFVLFQEEKLLFLRDSRIGASELWDRDRDNSLEQLLVMVAENNTAKPLLLTETMVVANNRAIIETYIFNPTIC